MDVLSIVMRETTLSDLERRTANEAGASLPMDEETEVEFKSRIPGRMHACGHDCHTSMLLGAARLLKDRQSQLHGTVKLIFQPAEDSKNIYDQIAK